MKYSLRSLLFNVTLVCILCAIFRRPLADKDFWYGVHDGALPIVWLFGFEFEKWTDCVFFGPVSQNDSVLAAIGFVVGVLLNILFVVTLIIIPTTIYNLLIKEPKNDRKKHPTD